MNEPTAEELANYRVDKSTWARGPWDREPDRVQWQHAGYACLMRRHPRDGFWCGYVGIDEAHPAFAKDWQGEAFPALENEVNYSDFCGGTICHVPEPDMPERVWWIGFDCGHAWDIAPGLDARARSMMKYTAAEEVIGGVFRQSYNTEAYVRRRVEALADELRGMVE
jgi:hypothetical protein